MSISKLKSLRKSSLFDLALQVRLRESTIAAIENRKTVAYPKQRAALAAFYELNEDELFGTDGFAKLAEAD